jgi:hypothetical protein
MAQYEGNVFMGARVILDGSSFVRCHFENCRLVFSGTASVTLIENVILNSTWEFVGPAEYTLQFLKALYHFGPSGTELVEDIFHSIRVADPLPATPDLPQNVAP